MMLDIVKGLLVSLPLLGPVVDGNYLYLAEDLGPLPDRPAFRLIRQVQVDTAGEWKAWKSFRSVDCSTRSIEPDGTTPDPVSVQLAQLACQ